MLIRLVATKLDAAETLNMRVADLLLATSKYGWESVPQHYVQHLAQAAEAYQAAHQ